MKLLVTKEDKSAFLNVELSLCEGFIILHSHFCYIQTFNNDEQNI